MSEMIDHVARAIEEAADRYGHFDPAVLARAAIEAMRSPSAAMLEAGSEAMKGREIHGPAKFATLQVGYLAMLNAALADDEKAVTP